MKLTFPMALDLRRGAVRVNERHGALPIRHISPWRRSIVTLLVLRVLTFTIGCEPEPGTKGGECKDNGCNLYCDDRLVCDNQTGKCIEEN